MAIIIFIMGNLEKIFKDAVLFSSRFFFLHFCGAVCNVYGRKHASEIRVLPSYPSSRGKLLNLDKLHIPICKLG